MVRCLFPFCQAKKSDFWYNLVHKDDKESYFANVDNKNTLSEDIKDLIWWMLAEDGSKRPTIEMVKNHPWVLSNFSKDKEFIRASLIEKF